MSNDHVKYIQGDVIFTKIDSLPADVKKLEGKILQASEVTGNFHQFTESSAVEIFALRLVADREPSINTITPDEGKYIVVDGLATLFHGKEGELRPDPVARGVADHEAFRLPEGIYQINIVREYDYETRMSVRVQD